MLSVTMLREALDDIRRYKRDKEVNSQSYKKLTPRGETFVASSDIKVGDLIFVEKVNDFSLLSVLASHRSDDRSVYVRFQ